MTAQMPPQDRVPPPYGAPYHPQHTGPHTYRPQHTGPYGAPHTSSPAPYTQHLRPEPAPYVTSTPHVIRGDRNGMGTAGLVLGIVSLCFAVLPIVGLIAWGVWPVGAALSWAGMARSDRAIATNRNIAVAGLCTSLAAGAVCIGWVVFTIVATSTGSR